MIETIQTFVNSLAVMAEPFVVPDWGALISLLPIFLLLFVVGPLITLAILGWIRYLAKKPRTRVSFADPRRPAPLDAAGDPVFPTGEPYSPREAMVYEPGATRSASGERLVVACPKCSLVRYADEDTCGNCGLSFTLKPTTRSLRPAAPPPGGRAAV